MVVIESWTEYRPILTFPVGGYIEINHSINGQQKTKRVGCFSVFADSLWRNDLIECERMLEEYEQRKE